MNRFVINIARALFLCGLFVFALIYQGVHQFNNPAEGIIDCQIADKHFHQDPEFHECDICEFLMTDIVNPLIVSEPYPLEQPVITPSFNEDPVLQKIRLYALRGPPHV